MNQSHEEQGSDSRHNKVEIKVNLREQTVPHGKISFDTVVHFGYPNDTPNPEVIYKVSWIRPKSKGHPQEEGKLVEGSSVIVTEHMEFEVVKSNRS